jgi:hypothetical protein
MKKDKKVLRTMMDSFEKHHRQFTALTWHISQALRP